MTTLLDQLKAYFTQDEWQFEQHITDPILQMSFVAKENAWVCYAQALEAEAQFVFYSLAPITVTRPKLWLCADYLMRANYNLILGNFELEMDSGEVRFKTSIDVEGDRLSYALFRPVVYSNLAMMERYLPGLKLIINEHMQPAEALKRAEK
jgi:hypothetical protein